MTTSSLRFGVWFGACLLAACGQPSSPASERKQPPSREAAPEPSPTPTPAPAPARERAYVGVDGVGLHVIDEGGWRLLSSTRSSVRDLLALDGQLFALSAFGVQRVDDEGQAETVVAFDRETYSKLGEPVAFASADGQEFWVVGPRGVGRYSGRWELDSLEVSDPPGIDLALDPAGQPYLAFGSLLRRQQDRWEPVSDLRPLALLADPRSEAILVHAGCDAGTCVLLRASAKQEPTRTTIPLGDDCLDHRHMAVSPDGAQAVLAGRCGLVRLSLEGDPKPRSLGLAEGWPGQPLRSLALDAGGRVWVGTSNGLMIVGTDERIEEYPIAKLQEVAGVVGPILVEGHGPPPPPLSRVRVGGLSGVIVIREGDGTRPLAKVRVELCNRLPPGPEPAPDPTRSPCAGAESVHTTTTDAEGRFEISNVTIDHYFFGVEINGRWARAQPKALNMRAGMSGNIGKIVVDPI
ncbi:MAG: hypothetical protein R6X02_05610 [Enhygromyxa sp.]